tara:strand:- start:391 stop:663 length:273 start_codon:yes stop_codon:yes gene_type:complete
MTDMLGAEINVGDVVIYPGGNARYGGLKLIVGVVSKMTPKRATIAYCNIDSDGSSVKTSSKTGAKVLVVADKSVTESEAVKGILTFLQSE